MNLDPAAIRNVYLKRMQSFLDDLQNIITGLGGDYVRLVTNHDLSESLSWFLRQRAARGK
jgi:hypothetical protein